MEEIKLGEVAHSRLGASSAKRWMNCPGSNNLVARLAKEHGEAKIFKNNMAAALGTAAHHVGSECLKSGEDAWTMMGQKISVTPEFPPFVVDKTMADGVQLYLDAVREKLAQHAGATLKIEHSMQSITDEAAFGTSDTIIFVPGSDGRPPRIIVKDYKNGFITVEPTEEQLKYYGYLTIEEHDAPPETIVECYIVQPNQPHPKGPIRLAVYSAKELTEWWYSEVLPAMKRTRDPNATLNMGEWCRWCPASDFCPAARQGFQEVAAVVKAPDAMTNEEIGAILAKKTAVDALFSSLEAEAFKRAMKGEKIPGRKLVQQKGNRVFKDQMEERDAEGNVIRVRKLEDEAKELFGTEAYEKPRLKSPAQLEKVMVGTNSGKAFVRLWAYSPLKGLTLAPESDKRDEAKPMLDVLIDQLNAEDKADAQALAA